MLIKRIAQACRAGGRPRALVLALAALVAGLGSLVVPEAWDSAQLLLRVSAGVAAVAALLTLVPRTAGRVVISLLLVFHLGGLVTAVTSVPPPGAPAPWVVTQLWTRCYRPYLQFLYLNNAYHFYSPEPGPASLLWSCVSYEDGSSRWVKVPNRRRDARDPLALEYYRRLALTESTNQLEPVQVLSAEASQRRALAGQLLGLPSPDELALYLPGVPQFRVPGDTSRRLLQNYARFLAATHPHPDPAVGVRGVKVYRIVHAMSSPADFAAGRSPLDPTLYLPYYQGEFDREGNLKNPGDPFLYWLLPILRADEGGPAVASGSGRSATLVVRDFVAIHAGSDPGREGE
jgi:hypothetical protein